jgi:hypothetical protein
MPLSVQRIYLSMPPDKRQRFEKTKCGRIRKLYWDNK